MLDLRSSNEHREQYKNYKLKIIAPTSNDEFELHDSSYSVSADIKFIIKNNETLPNPPIHTYISRINATLVFKIKYCYKLEMKHQK